MKGRTQLSLKQAIVLFHSGAYIEFQEAIEALYPGAEGYDCFFYEALVQLAIGIRLLQEFGSRGGAERVLRQALLRLKSIPRTHQKIKIGVLIRDIQDLLERLKSSANHTIPRLRLKFWS
jgi:hypothetical protein